jgi:hypothetical protein
MYIFVRPRVWIKDRNKNTQDLYFFLKEYFIINDNFKMQLLKKAMIIGFFGFSCNGNVEFYKQSLYVGFSDGCPACF